MIPASPTSADSSSFSERLKDTYRHKGITDWRNSKSFENPSTKNTRSHQDDWESAKSWFCSPNLETLCFNDMERYRGLIPGKKLHSLKTDQDNIKDEDLGFLVDNVETLRKLCLPKLPFGTASMGYLIDIAAR
ncbi:hypothetical protein BGZ93_004313 [Podila epicladia]|nr:hypothetical protein BGZ93_004313 [Podila epicladia]